MRVVRLAVGAVGLRRSESLSGSSEAGRESRDGAERVGHVQSIRHVETFVKSVPCRFFFCNVFDNQCAPTA